MLQRRPQHNQQGADSAKMRSSQAEHLIVGGVALPGAVTCAHINTNKCQGG
jgi:hypothetical protein